jgi:hypothetical protein
VLALSLCFLGVASSARSQEASPVASQPPQAADVIEVTVVGRVELLGRVRGALAPQSFAPASLRWLWRERWDPSELISRSAADSDVLLRCWLVLSDPAHAHLYFADRAAKRFLIRDLELTGRLDELDREALSQALELSIRALLEDEVAGIDREEARSLLTPKVSPARLTQGKPLPAVHAAAELPAGLYASASWQIELHSRQIGFVQGPGLSLGYERWVAHWRAALWAGAQYQLQKTYTGSLAGVALQTFTFRSGLRLLRPLFNSTWFAGALLGGGVDLTQFAPRLGRSEATAVLTPARSRAVPVLSGGALLGKEFASHFRFSVALLTSFPLLNLKYDVEVAGVRERVVDSWPVRPGVAIALDMD